MELSEFTNVPIVDVGGLVGQGGDAVAVAEQLGRACRDVGFFYIVNHGVAQSLIDRLENLSRQFFRLDRQEKMKIAMVHGGRAWRGYFPVGDELTSGKPDWKEGIYFGSQLPPDHPEVRAGTPLHGPNLFPDIDGFRETVLEYITATTQLGHSLMSGMALSLGLAAEHFQRHYTGNPLILFRVFNYPQVPTAAQDTQPTWGVGEHTDYGLLTILKQDDSGGLQVKSRSRWIDAPPIPESFVCNIGDMLQRLTHGIYRSTPHRVVNRAQRDRLSFPLFFDPGFHSDIRPIEQLRMAAREDDRAERWDQASVHEFSGTYGDYLLNKVSKVFPQLRREVL
ncbi:MAG: isopenicillin N synthase family oxygenase [Pirellulaceae bacterium]|nr:isopenicillin N synthase family oxygenase [Pirellulaceae bacterium]